MKRLSFLKALGLWCLVGCVSIVLSACMGPTEKERAQENVASSSILTVGASARPSAAILNDPVRKQLEALGYELNVVEYVDASAANQALLDRELDAVYMEHERYLDAYTERWGPHLSALTAIQFEPMGLYSTSYTSLDDVPEGAQVAIPNDPSNRARALLLLEQAGLLRLDPYASRDATQEAIAENPRDLAIVEVSPADMPQALEDGALVALTVAGAYDAELKPEAALASESPYQLDSLAYATALVVYTGTEQEPKIEALAGALTSQATWNFITATYNNTVVPVFTVEASPALKSSE